MKSRCNGRFLGNLFFLWWLDICSLRHFSHCLHQVHHWWRCQIITVFPWRQIILPLSLPQWHIKPGCLVKGFKLSNLVMTETLLLVDQTGCDPVLGAEKVSCGGGESHGDGECLLAGGLNGERREESRARGAELDWAVWVSVGQYHCTVTSGHLNTAVTADNKVIRLFWFNFVLNRASENFAIYYKTHCVDRCKSEVDTKDWSIKMLSRVIEHTCAANHLLVMYKATYSLIIQICHLNSEI